MGQAQLQWWVGSPAELVFMVAVSPGIASLALSASMSAVKLRGEGVAA